MDVLYIKSDKKSSSQLIGRTEYGATYHDNELSMCLMSLKAGDTLYVERESFLADSVAEAVTLLGNLARRGVNVYLERKNELIRSETSPFRQLTGDLAQAVIGFRKAFTKFRQREGYKKAKAEGRKIAVSKRPLPSNFENVKQRWLKKEITVVEAAAECEMAVSTFWTRCKEA